MRSLAASAAPTRRALPHGEASRREWAVCANAFRRPRHVVPPLAAGRAGRISVRRDWRCRRRVVKRSSSGPSYGAPSPRPRARPRRGRAEQARRADRGRPRPRSGGGSAWSSRGRVAVRPRERRRVARRCRCRAGALAVVVARRRRFRVFATAGALPAWRANSVSRRFRSPPRARVPRSSSSSSRTRGRTSAGVSFSASSSSAAVDWARYLSNTAMRSVQDVALGRASDLRAPPARRGGGRCAFGRARPPSMISSSRLRLVHRRALQQLVLLPPHRAAASLKRAPGRSEHHAPPVPAGTLPRASSSRPALPRALPWPPRAALPRLQLLARFGEPRLIPCALAVPPTRARHRRAVSPKRSPWRARGIGT